MRALPFEPGVAGCDEAGRGPLAGPVVCAAVVLPAGFDARGLDDSKKLDAPRRAMLANRVRDGAVWAVEVVPADEVDRLNVLWASLAGMERALARLDPAPRAALIDGHTPPREPCVPVTCLVKGDGKDAAIAAASILAKTVRDGLMVELAAEFPKYGFDRHFGYPTPDHLAALREHGPCPAHRRSFGPVRDLLEQPCLGFDG